MAFALRQLFHHFLKGAVRYRPAINLHNALLPIEQRRVGYCHPFEAVIYLFITEQDYIVDLVLFYKRLNNFDAAFISYIERLGGLDRP
jgi:hypothetical protein